MFHYLEGDDRETLGYHLPTIYFVDPELYVINIYSVLVMKGVTPILSTTKEKEDVTSLV